MLKKVFGKSGEEEYEGVSLADDEQCHFYVGTHYIEN